MTTTKYDECFGCERRVRLGVKYCAVCMKRVAVVETYHHGIIYDHTPIPVDKTIKRAAGLNGDAELSAEQRKREYEKDDEEITD